MDKKWFHEHANEIGVPNTEVIHAIKTGINLASERKLHQKKKTPNRVALLALAVAVSISTTFAFPSMSHVMADVPFIGKVYEVFNDSVGRNLASQELVTKLNEKAHDNRIDVVITNAYYDGATIGVTFHATGKLKPESDNEIYAYYEIFGGESKISDSKEIVKLQPGDDGFIGHIQLNYPYGKIPKEATIPLTIKRFGKTKGSWKFDVPIKQLPYRTISTDLVTAHPGSKVELKVNSVILGQSSGAIDYEVIKKQDDVQDQVRLHILDDQENRFERLTTGIELGTESESGKFIQKQRAIIYQPLNEAMKFITIQPELVLVEHPRFVELDQQMPLVVLSERQELGVKIEKLEGKEDQLRVVFQLIVDKNRRREFTFYRDVARDDVQLVKKSEKDIYQEPLMHKVKVLDKQTLRFSSTFDLKEIKKFDPDEYVLRVDLGTMSNNMPFLLEPVQIELQ